MKKDIEIDSDGGRKEEGLRGRRERQGETSRSTGVRREEGRRMKRGGER